ncbi:MAG: hypothetical protein JXB05_33725 [Myxococcaceae bacterium]|nr:hypothetical protein [Myxococcaceae bacterium]
MSRFIRLSILAAATAALMACGGGGAKLGGGKEGAAKALFEASQPAGQGGKSNGQALIERLASAAQSIGNADRSVDCAHSGSVALKLDLTSVIVDGTGEVKFKSEVDYKGCNEDGANEFNGKMTMEFKLSALGSAATIELKLKGKIEISGEIEDFLDADVTQIISAAATSQTTGSATITITGTIKTSESTYTYDGTPLTITVEGHIPAADGNS